MMKKLMSMLILCRLMLSLGGCGAEENMVVTPNSFPLETDFINGTLAENGIDFTVEDSRDYSDLDEIFNYIYMIDKEDLISRESFGSLHVIWGPEYGNYIEIVTAPEKGDRAGAQKIVKTVCSLYGSPDGGKVSRKLAKDMKSGENLEKIENGGYKWEYELNGVYYSATFSYKVHFDGSETVSLVIFSASDALHKDYSEKERADPDSTLNKLQRENREKYPLLYTTDKTDYPPQPADDELISLLARHGLGITARTAAVSTVNGTYLTQYTLWNENGEELGTATVRDYVSGRRISVSYNIMETDFNLREHAIENAVKTACVLYGIPEKAETIASGTEVVVQGYDYTKDGSLNIPFEYEGVYGTMDFGFESFEAQKAGRAQFRGLSLYEPRLYAALEQYGMI